MAGKSATLTIQIVSDARKASAGFADAEKKVGGFQRGLDRASVAAGGVLLGLAGVAKEAFDSASALQQSTGAVESVFGAQAAAVQKYAAAAAQAVGLSENSYQELASVVGSQLKNMGIAHDELVPKTNQLIELGADLAATYGGTTADAVAALSSLLRGETDPIERYGVSIKQADINARLAAAGLDELEGPAAKAAQAQAVLGLLADQTGSAMGAFARESDTAAGAQQRASAEFENAKAALGEALLPVVSEAMEKLAGLSHWAKDNSTTVGALALVIGGLALVVLGVNAAFSAYRAVMIVAAAVQWAFNTALLSNPLTWVALAVVAVVAGMVLLYQKVGWVRDLFSVVGMVFTSPFKAAKLAVEALMTPITWVLDKLSWVKDAAGSVAGWFSAPAAVGPAGGGGAVSAFGGGGGSMVRGGGGGMLSLGGGGSSTSLPTGPSTVVQISMDGLVVDGVATGRKLVQVLQEYAQSTGGAVAVQVGRS